MFLAGLACTCPGLPRSGGRRAGLQSLGPATGFAAIVLRRGQAAVAGYWLASGVYKVKLAALRPGFCRIEENIVPAQQREIRVRLLPDRDKTRHCRTLRTTRWPHSHPHKDQ